MWGDKKKLRGAPVLRGRGHVQEKQVTVKEKSNWEQTPAGHWLHNFASSPSSHELWVSSGRTQLWPITPGDMVSSSKPSSDATTSLLYLPFKRGWIKITGWESIYVVAFSQPRGSQAFIRLRLKSSIPSGPQPYAGGERTKQLSTQPAGQREARARWPLVWGLKAQKSMWTESQAKLPLLGFLFFL